MALKDAMSAMGWGQVLKELQRISYYDYNLQLDEKDTLWVYCH